MKYLKLYEKHKEKSFDDYIRNEMWRVNDILDVSNIDCSSYNLDNLDGIEKFINLKTLYCHINNLKNLNGIKNSIKLISLSCAKNKLMNLKGIENLINLEELNCSHNKLTNLKEIENLTNINLIQCNDNLLEEITEIKNLKGLTYLECYGNPLKFPLSKDIINNVSVAYGKENYDKFSSYEFQREFLTKYPERIQDLEHFGYHKKIKEEFADLIEGNEFGFFNLR